MATARTKKDITVEETATAKTLATEVKVKEVEKEKKVFSDSDYILCRSVCYGGLNIK